MGDDDLVKPSAGASPAHATALVEHDDIKAVIGQKTGSGGTGQTGSNHDDGVFGGGGRLIGKGTVAVHVDAAHVGSSVPLSYETEDRRRWVEGPIEQTVTPLDTDHRRGVAPVQRIHVVEGLPVGH